VLHLGFYRSLAKGLPALEKLWLGDAEFATQSWLEGGRYYERMPLHHLTAFYRMLPHLVEVSMGTVDGAARRKHLRPTEHVSVLNR
jgi:hypothetical protein